MNKIQAVILSLLSAVLMSLAWPANGFAPLIFVAWVPLLFVQDQLGQSGEKGMFWLAWLCFFVWNALTTWWIWNSTEVGAIGAILLNSFFMTVVFWMFHLTKKFMYDNRKGFAILIFYWLSWEWFHLDWDLSWPWLNLGHVFSTQHKWIQWYEYTGVAGGTAWILVVNIMVFQLIRNLGSDKTPINRIWKQAAGILTVILIPILASLWIYHSYEESGQAVNIVVVQPNLDPYSEQYGLAPESVIQRNLELALQKLDEDTDFIVAPESAIQEEIWEEQLHKSSGLNLLKSFIVQHPKTAILIGASTFSMVPNGMEAHPAARKFRTMEGYYFAYNTVFYLDSTSYIQSYHKSKLTPGVEMMPSWWWLRPLRNYAIDLGGTVGTLKTDEERQVFLNQDKRFRIAPVICYESVYGEFVTRYIRKGANLIFIATNDGWWGNTPGYKQHLEFAKLRAIETRRSIARSANTGVSAFVDQRGELHQTTAYWQPDVIKQKLITNEKITVYVRFGDYIARVALFVSAIFLINAIIRRILKLQKAL